MSFIMQTQQSTSQANGLWLVIGAAILWGTIGIATQAIYQLDSTSSLFINLTRLLVATPILWLACWQSIGPRMFQLPKRDLAMMCLNGVMLALSQAAYFASIRYAGVTIATLLTICLAPLVVVYVAAWLRLEQLTKRVLVSLGCALVGSVLLVGLQSIEGNAHHLWIGSGLAIFSAVGYAGMVVGGRLLARHHYPPLQVTAFTFGAGSVVLLILNVVSGVVLVHTAQGWLLALYLGIVPTALAYWLFQTGLRSVSATSASLIGLLDPVVAAGLAWVLFGERLSPLSLIGAGLLLASIAVLAVGESR